MNSSGNVTPYVNLAGKCFLAFFMAAATSLLAQDYPAKNIRIVVGSSAGGGGDSVVRIVSAPLAERLGQQVIIDNRPGAGGNIGADMVAKARPDGYTLLLAFSSHVLNPSLYPKLPFDSVRDFSPVAMLATNEILFVAHPTMPAKSVKELIDIAMKAPGKFTIAGLPASVQQLGAELLRQSAGIDLVFVPYKGSAPALTDLLGGQVDVMFNTITVTLPHVRSGKLRALASAGLKRSRLIPDLPTVSESALPGFSLAPWYGILAPAGTPESIVIRLNRALVQILNSADTKQRLTSMGYEPVGNSPAEFDKFIREEIPKWGKVIKDAGIRVEP